MERKARQPGEVRSAWIGGVICWAMAVVFAAAAVYSCWRPVPGWYSLFLALLAGFEAAMGVWSFRRSRRFRREVREQEVRCPRCGYDLTGNVSGVCPECGTSVTWDRAR